MFRQTIGRLIRVRLILVIILFVLFGLMIGFYDKFLEQMIVNINTNKYQEEFPTELDENSSHLKKILFYTPFFSRKDYAFGYGNKPFIENRCPVNNCFTTNNRNLKSKNNAKNHPLSKKI